MYDYAHLESIRKISTAMLRYLVALLDSSKGLATNSTWPSTVTAFCFVVGFCFVSYLGFHFATICVEHVFELVKMLLEILIQAAFAAFFLSTIAKVRRLRGTLSDTTQTTRWSYLFRLTAVQLVCGMMPILTRVE